MSGEVRFIILPGEIRKDDRLTLSHLKVALVLGAYSKQYGWTDLTQNDVGEMAGLSRETVCRCVGDLVDWGWVVRRKKKAKNQYVYRFIMDREDYCELAVTSPHEHCDGAVTGNVISGFTSNKEKTSTLSQSTLSAPLPPKAQQAPSGQIDESIGKGSVHGVLRITPREGAWTRWIDHITAKAGSSVADAAVMAGVLEVTTRWPEADTPLPKIPRLTS